MKANTRPENARIAGRNEYLEQPSRGGGTPQPGLTKSTPRYIGVEMADAKNSARLTERRPYTVRGWKRTGSELDRFMEKVEKTDTCWIWRGAITGRGYGSFASTTERYPHRWSYAHFVGPIPDGYQIDHLCRVLWCVNPSHLEAVTGAENMRRAVAARSVASHCKRGHEWTEANTRFMANGSRACVQCRRLLERQRVTKAENERRASQVSSS